ncbi:MAG: hypothetical protein JWM93_56 [Frankiales bacterium]|nr:hypothetical protein [Frankiales bacterium]
MPLSDHEQRMLAEIERALYAEDPKFAASVRTTTLQSRYQRRIAVAIAVIVLGLVLLPVGLAVRVMPLGVLGFVMMLVGALSAVSNVKRMRSGVAPPSGSRFGRRARLRAVGDPAGPSSRGSGGRPKPGRSGGPRGGLGQRFHDRWERRMEGRWRDDN